MNSNTWHEMDITRELRAARKNQTPKTIWFTGLSGSGKSTLAKEIVGAENFIEVYVSTPLEECEKRDVKGLYKKARLGEIPNFTGISAPYERPEKPDITIDTSNYSVEEAADQVFKELLTIIGEEQSH